MESLREKAEYRAAVYLRLSKEDGDGAGRGGRPESNSITNQRAIILNHLKKLPDVAVIDFFVDDGFTGTNFLRPGFQAMMEAVREGRINMVAVKDLSRLGREYVETGRYIKKIFPAMGVRFLTVMEEFDSAKAAPTDYNLLLPVHNVLNDQYSLDISCKVRGSQSAMRREGLYIGPYVGYGRKKSPKDGHVILLDEYAGGIIKDMIQDLYLGYTVRQISQRLNRRGVLAPADYKRRQGIAFQSGFWRGEHSRWTPKAVTRALTDPMNVGTMVQGRRQRISYKVRRVVEKPPGEQDIIHGAVPPLVSQDCHDHVRKLLLADMRTVPGQETVYLFGGLLYCGDCEKSMIRRKCGREGLETSYICSSYNKHEGCAGHRIREELLCQAVLAVLRCHGIAFADLDKVLAAVDLSAIEKKDRRRCAGEFLNQKRELERCQKLMAGLEDDRASGIISREEYLEFMDYYGRQREKHKEILEGLKGRLKELKLSREENRRRMEGLTAGRTIGELNHLMLVLLVDGIFVHEGNRIEIVVRYRDELPLETR